MNEKVWESKDLLFIMKYVETINKDVVDDFDGMYVPGVSPERWEELKESLKRNLE